MQIPLLKEHGAPKLGSVPIQIPAATNTPNDYRKGQAISIKGSYWLTLPSGAR